MWICLSESFLSIVTAPKQPKLLLVRARVKGDIERVFPDAKVTRTPERDYLFRSFIPRTVVGEAIGKLAASVSCDNFKNSVPDDDRHDAYASCWSAMNRLQQIKARPPAKAKRVVAVDYDDDSGDGQLGMPDWVPQRQKGWAGL